MTEGVSFERLRLNHYVIKSEEEFRLKAARGPADAALRTMRTGNRFSEARLARMARRYNDIEDRTIQMYLAELKEALARHEPADPVTGPTRSLGG